MFKISFPGLEVKIEGCPEAGIAAIDFRRKHGLPEAPTNKQAIPLELTSERLVRKYAAHADHSGDLASYAHPRYGNQCSDRTTMESSVSSGIVTQHVVSPMAVLGGLSGTEDGVDALLVELAADKQGAAERAKKEAEESKAIHELLADVDKSAEACIYRNAGGKPGHRWSLTLNHPHRNTLGGFPAKTNRREVQPIVDTAKYLCDERNAMDLANDEAEKAATLADMAAWINTHGSIRLQRSLAEGIECQAAYRDERLAVERPDWEWYADVDGKISEPRNPPEDAFGILDEARKSDPAAKLAFYAYDESADEYGDAYRTEGYVAESEFLSRKIVYGVDQLERMEVESE